MSSASFRRESVSFRRLAPWAALCLTALNTRADAAYFVLIPP